MDGYYIKRFVQPEKTENKNRYLYDKCAFGYELSEE